MGFSKYTDSKTGSRFGSLASKSQNGEYNLGNVQRQLENASVRIKDAGYPVKDADSRNWFEKLTNLPEHQNAFFDTLELLFRPGQAVVSGIHSSNQGRDFLQGAHQGFSGQDRTRGTDLAEDWGVDNKVGKFILGTALEIGLDPLTYVPGGVLLKGAKAGAKVAGQGVKGVYKAAENTIPGFARFSENQLKPAAESTKDALGYMFKRDYKAGETLTGGESTFLKDLSQETDDARHFMQEESLKNVSDAAKLAGGVDTGVDVGRVMEAPLRQFEDVQMYEFPDGVRRTTSKRELKNEIVGNQQKISGLGKEVRETDKQFQDAISVFASGIEKTNSEIRRLYSSIEKNAGKQLDAEKRVELREATRQLQRVNSQVDSLPQAEASLLRYYKNQVREAHEMQFDILKRIRSVAPNGVKAVEGFDIPEKLAGNMRLIGKPLDEVADELGYTYADEMIQALKTLDGVPRKLGKTDVETLARKEMERSGALADLQGKHADLQGARDTLQKLIGDISIHVPNVEGKAFATLESNPRWQELETQRLTLRKQYDDLKGESKQVRESKLDEIKKVEDEIAALKEAGKNPLMVQREIPRPARDLPTDPRITEAAAKITQSDNALRQYATDNGINISELEGYMTHVLSKAEREARKKNRPITVDQGAFGQGNPNKKILNQRQLAGSAEDVNEQVGRQLFEPNAYFATAIGQKRLIEYMQAVTFRRKVLSNPEFAQKYEKGVQLGKNQVIIDTNNYKFINEGNDMLEGLADEIGGQYVVTKAVKNSLDRYQKLNTDEGTKAFLKTLDVVQNQWKKMALFSAGYHVRNMFGAMFNNYIGGMSTVNLAKYTGQASKEVMDALKGQESAMFNEFRKQGLSSTNLSGVESLRSIDPEKAIEKTIKERSKDAKGKVVDRLKPWRAFETSREAGQVMDQVNRFALFKWAIDKGLTPNQAAAKVREVQFDYSKLSSFESNVAARAVPFYRWMRNNIPFQIKQFANDPRKYQNVNKVRLNAQDAAGIDEENVPDYMKNNFAIPVSGEDGKGKMLGLNLPVSDLTKLSNPLKTIVDALSPLIKLPEELALNRNFFYNKPIKEFAGQEKQYDNPLTGGTAGVDQTLAYVLEQLTGQVGRGLSGFLQSPDNVNQDTKFRMPTFGISGMLKDFDADKSKYFEQRQQLQQLLDLIKVIEQQTGQDVPTVNQIRAAGR